MKQPDANQILREMGVDALRTVIDGRLPEMIRAEAKPKILKRRAEDNIGPRLRRAPNPG